MVTFFLTDVEGSTRLWEERPDDMATAIADHESLLAGVVRRNGGELLKSRGEGDSTFSVFDDPAGAIAAALDAQRALGDAIFRVRIAIHTGHSEARDGDYFGPTVNRCARLRGAAHGGQVVLSLVTRQLARDRLPEGASLLDLGMHHLRDLTEPERVYQLCHPDIAADFPPLTSLDRQRHNLPSALTRFVGRSAELAELDDALRDARLLTLIGAGGTGKTRLALEAANRRVDDYRDGVWLVELAGVTDPEQVLDSVATTLGVREMPGQPIADTLTRYLAEREILVLLDNCEHVIAAAAAAVELLLRSGMGVRVLATSRHALGIGGEQLWPVPPLTFPEDAAFADSEAVALFIDRARVVNPHMVIGTAEQEVVSQICRQLDGLPLAIELAAALVDRLSIRTIAERLPDRFELLTSGPRDAAARQRSLAAAVDWSYDLLEARAREAFAQLSVFPAGFDVAGAEAVVGNGALDAVSELVAASLVLHAGGRYSLLDTMRSYAAERLAGSGQAGAVYDRFVAWASAVVAGEDLDRLELERANLLAALRWSIGRAQGDALELANKLGRLWEQRGYWSEGRRLLDDVLAQPGGDADLRASALLIAGRLARGQGDFAQAERLLRESLELSEALDDDSHVYKALTDLGGLAHMRGDAEDARMHFDAALAIGETLNDPRSVGGALGNLGILAHATGDLAAAEAFYDQALRTARQVGDGLFLAGVLNNAGMLHEARGNLDAASAAFAEALELTRANGSSVDMASTLAQLADLNQRQGDMESARAQFAEALEIFHDLGDRPDVANVLYGLGELAIKERRTDDARKLLEESLDIWREIGHALGEAAVLLSIGELERRDGRLEAASSHIQTALASLHALQNRAGVANALDLLAAVAADHGAYERAAELLGAAETAYERMGAPVPPVEDRPVDPTNVRFVLGDAPYEQALSRGVAHDDESAVALGLTKSS